ncbi:MAG: enoyl-CoA hydratase-related protein [Candidatus Aphodosoma sp.]
MECNFVRTETPREGVALITISSPKTLNALNRTILGELDYSVANLSKDTRVLIITGEGKAFVAGADISQMRDFNDGQGLEFSRFGASVFRRIEELEIPVIAAVNGFALGGGCELALACDIRIAAETAVFGQPEVKLGILPGFSGSVRLPRLIGVGRAKELIYTGRNVKAQEAYQMGLVNAVVPLESLMDEVYRMADQIMACAPLAVRAAKESVNHGADLEIDAAIGLESRLFGRLFASADQKEGMAAFLEKRKATFKNN